MILDRLRELVGRDGGVVAFGDPGAKRSATAANGSFAPDAFITIDASGQVTLTMHYVEMGQGAYTAIPVLMIEELEVDVKRMRLQQAPANAQPYGNRFLADDQITGNATAIRASWEPMRRAGATARTMLVQAAASRWRVEPAACRADAVRLCHVRGQRTVRQALSARRASIVAATGTRIRELPIRDQAKNTS